MKQSILNSAIALEMKEFDNEIEEKLMKLVNESNFNRFLHYLPCFN